MPDDEPSEVFYGGAAGGGKSDWLLMGALEYADVPGYAAIIFRRTFTDLALPGAIMQRAAEWLAPFRQTGQAHWSGQDKRWTFPSGASLQFAYLEHEDDIYRYQSAEFQYVGFDELTQFSERQYRYLFSRLRRRAMTDETPETERPKIEALSKVPLRMRAASNPGGVGHDWVRARFVDGRARSRAYVPAKLADNPNVDRDAYAKTLQHLDPVTRTRLLDGDWSAREPGGFFRREWFVNADHPVVDYRPDGCRGLRFWDLAATEPTSANPDPDWTVGLRMWEMGGRFWVDDVIRIRESPKTVEQRILATAMIDGPTVAIRMEQEPAASGKTVIADYRTRVLAGYDFRGIPSSGSKEDRARPVSSRAEAGDITLVRGAWIPAFLDQLEAYTGDVDQHAHDDIVDGLSGAYRELTLGRGEATQEAYVDVGPEPVVRKADMVLRGAQYVDAL